LAAHLFALGACGRTNLRALGTAAASGGDLGVGGEPIGGGPGEGGGIDVGVGAGGTVGTGGSGGAPASCGNGVLDPGEACDDGNGSNTDACLASCVLASCGDGFVFAGVEQCDDGNGSNTDACLASCVLASCGDGFVFAGVEQCDDGNKVNEDGCRNNCVLPFCGDGIVDPGEQCDDGNTQDGDFCSSTCKLPFCGDGTLQPGEQCDLGGANADRPALEIEQGGVKTAVRPYDQAQDPALFYNYFSASSHTGFEQLFASRIYFYRSTVSEQLALFMHHAIDQSNQPVTDVLFSFTGLPSASSVAVSDDVSAMTGPELAKTGVSTAVGDWTFANNTDGGVIVGLPFPGSWEVTLAPTFSAGITTWDWVHHDKTLTPLKLNTTLLMRAFDTPAGCRTDCTVPKCGDTIVDGGEVCDDGNTVGGDGCSADCKSINK
jgi:cysteine-rich repeat protein